MKHWQSVLKIPIYNLNYSDLVTNPEETVRKLLDFVEVDWDEECLQFYESKRHVPTASYDQVTQKMYTSSLQRWKNYENHLEPLIRTFESLGIDLNSYS